MGARETSVLCAICGETATATLGADTPEFARSAVRWAVHFAMEHPGKPVDENTIVADADARVA